ncbi:HAL/PAL/TAL family ammonia-lyase [Thermanaerovibrio velox]|uniref:HAL/PAL/TAL family ammonia-lyase n=1 Tax=Thermanaerovibrio velox TaxID=108007 RepID=UPI001FE0647E|nr:aromatic amino acid ammonia-lyase [Thermanaerovibrio velox]
MTLGEGPIGVEQVVAAAFGEPVSVSGEALARCRAVWKALMDIADRGNPKVYGLNTGVGINKDQTVTRESYGVYNLNMLKVHCVGLSPYASAEEARGTMFLKLHHLAMGYTGITPGYVELLREMLNRGIYPAIPLRGSVGEADITSLSHLGLVMAGEGFVMDTQGLRPAGEALREAGLQPIKPGPKDGLGLVTSNALGEALGCLALHRAKSLMDLADLSYAMTLEGFHGNLSPLDERALALHPSKGVKVTASNARRFLTGSYLEGGAKSLQDPLSIRCSPMVHGAVRDALNAAEEALTGYINTPDDNPLAFEDGTVIPCALFEPLGWVLEFEKLKAALCHLSQTVARRTLRLGSDRFTGLPRFLNPCTSMCHAFGVIQKTVSYLQAENRHLSNPCSFDVESLSEDQEDRGCNTPMVMDHLKRMLDNLEVMLAIEILHGAQAMDMRGASYGRGTSRALGKLRERVPFMDEDRDLSLDVARAVEAVRSGELIEAARSPWGCGG